MMRTFELGPRRGLPWLCLGLAFTLAACPGEGTSDTGSNATETGTETGPGDATNDSSGDPTTAMTSEMSGQPSTGEPPTDCDPPCEDGEVCVEGTCMGAGDSTGQPAECGTTFTTNDPACDECWQASCCMALQACYGDETVVGPTPCAQVDACIELWCTEAMDMMTLQTCVDENCPDLSGEVGVWFGLTLCTFNNCNEICNPEER
jgi:hypothetical protein